MLGKITTLLGLVLAVTGAHADAVADFYGASRLA